MRSSTTTLISALRTLARDLESHDGIANAAISEAADRLEELSQPKEPKTISDIITFRGGVSCLFLASIIKAGNKQFKTEKQTLTCAQLECMRRAAALIEALLKDEIQVEYDTERTL